MSQNPQSSPVLLDSNKVATASWANIGPVINCEGSDSVGIFLNMIIGTDLNFRVRAIGRLTATGDDYLLPIRTASASDVKVEGQYIELNVDADQKIILEVETDQIVPFIQMQIQVGTVGGGPAHGTVLSMWKTERYGRFR